jgi:hypothetical protein
VHSAVAGFPANPAIVPLSELRRTLMSCRTLLVLSFLLLLVFLLFLSLLLLLFPLILACLLILARSLVSVRNGIPIFFLSFRMVWNRITGDFSYERFPFRETDGIPIENIKNSKISIYSVLRRIFFSRKMATHIGTSIRNANVRKRSEPKNVRI